MFLEKGGAKANTKFLRKTIPEWQQHGQSKC